MSAKSQRSISSHTSLGFYRKKQTLDNLKDERPKSLEVLRHILLDAAQNVDSRLSELEQIFCEGLECEAYIKCILPAFHDVMTNFQVTYFNGGWQVDDVMKRFRKHGVKYGARPESVALVTEYGTKVRQFLPANFQPLMSDIEEIVKYADKYCVSFYNKNKDSFLETPQHYDKIRVEYKDTIKMHLSNIDNMSRAYKGSGLVSSKHFGLNISEISRRCNIADIPVLLIFPEACNNIRLALQAVLRWVQLDAQYTEFIHNDVLDLEGQKEKQEKVLRECKDDVAMLDHKRKLCEREITDLDGQLKRLQPRTAQMDIDIGKLNMKIKDLELDIGMKEDERNDLRRYVKGSTSEEVKDDENERFETLSAEITKMKLTISVINRSIEQRKSKVRLIIERREKLDAKVKICARLQKQKVKAQTQVLLVTRHLERTVRCQGFLKLIYRLRTSPDITRKIFNNMPFEARNNRLMPKRNRPTTAPSNNSDDLDKALAVAAKRLGADWSKLYRALPYFPKRGEATLDNDVEEINRIYYRSNVETQARQSLNRWRRMNANSSLDELKKGLLQIGRGDVLDKIEKAMEAKEPVDAPIDKWKHFKQLTHAVRKFMLINQFSSAVSQPQTLQSVV